MTDRPMIYRDDAVAIVAAKVSAIGPRLDACEALAALAPVQVGVKPLEWVDNPDASEGGMLGGGVTNSVYHAMSDGWSFHRAMFWRKTDNLEAAKAAAQADYEARIRSAIAPVQVDAAHIRAEALREGYRLGFEASGEGWNGEYPFEGEVLEANEQWVAARDRSLAALIATPPPSPDVGALVRDLLEGYGASYIDSETWEKVTTEAKAFLDLAAQEGGDDPHS